MSDVSAVNFMTKPVLGDGTSGNVLVWNIGDVSEYSDSGSRATINEDKTVLFRNEDGVAVSSEVIWNGYVERPGFEITWETWNDMPLGTYYFKILYKTQKSWDLSIDNHDKDYAARVRLCNNETYDFGYVDPNKDGMWQREVIPFNITESNKGGTEMTFYNNWFGKFFDFTIGQYAVISLDDTPLISEYEDEEAIPQPPMWLSDLPVTAEGALYLLWHSVGDINLRYYYSLSSIDVNGDEKINAADALIVLRAALEIE